MVPSLSAISALQTELGSAEYSLQFMSFPWYYSFNKVLLPMESYKYKSSLSLAGKIMDDGNLLGY